MGANTYRLMSELRASERRARDGRRLARHAKVVFSST